MCSVCGLLGGSKRYDNTLLRRRSHSMLTKRQRYEQTITVYTHVQDASGEHTTLSVYF
jgi:hypothetical protein